MQLCIECQQPIHDKRAKRHRACHDRAYREANERLICECPPPRQIETFWMGRQCATCAKPFLEDLTPAVA